MRRALLTGGAGFIGSNIVEELLKRGHAVHVIGNFSTGRRGNVEAPKRRGMDRMSVFMVELDENANTRMCRLIAARRRLTAAWSKDCSL